MIGFFFHARFMMRGRQVKLQVYRGTRKIPGRSLGILLFEPDEWDAFRLILIAAIRAAGYARIPIEFLDGTRREPPTPPVLH